MMKLGSERDSLDLLKNGTVYFNTIEYFTREENITDIERYDADELTTNFKRFAGGKMRFKSMKPPHFDFELDVKDMCIREHMHQPLSNIYCLYAFPTDDKPDGYKFKLNEKLQGFGTHVVFMRNTKAFFERLSAKINEMQIAGQGSIVEYLDFSNYSGNKTFFMKDIKYQHQSEYRIVLHTNSNQPLKIMLGNLEDIAEIMETVKFKSLIKGSEIPEK